MTKTQLRHKLKLDMHPLVGGKKSLQVRIHKGITVFMESAFPQAVFASEVWQLDFSRQRDWFAVGNSRLGDFFVMNLKR